MRGNYGRDSRQKSMKKKLQAPAAVVQQFSDWCIPRRGTTNPENQTNEVWSWLIQTRASPHAAHESARVGDKQSPGWCFDRFGQSETQLPDGTVIFIGGEHEDHYDPDFYIAAGRSRTFAALKGVYVSAAIHCHGRKVVPL